MIWIGHSYSVKGFFMAKIMKKNIDPIIEEEFYCLVAPDGSLQVSSLTPDYPMCLAFTKLLNESGMGMSLNELRKKGFTFQKVIVTIREINNG